MNKKENIIFLGCMVVSSLIGMTIGNYLYPMDSGYTLNMVKALIGASYIFFALWYMNKNKNE